MNTCVYCFYFTVMGQCSQVCLWVANSYNSKMRGCNIKLLPKLVGDAAVYVRYVHTYVHVDQSSYCNVWPHTICLDTMASCDLGIPMYCKWAWLFRLVDIRDCLLSWCGYKKATYVHFIVRHLPSPRLQYDIEIRAEWLSSEVF